MRGSLSVVLVLICGAAPAADPLQACAAITSNSKRLACYDKLAQKSESQAGFGADSIRGKPRPAEPERLRAHLRGEFSGWKHGTRLELDNGQVWKVEDHYEFALGQPRQQPEVVLERGLLGSYFLTVDGFDRRAKVHRLK